MNEDSYYDDDGKVICQVCGDSFKSLAAHVCRIHELPSIEAYRDQFPGAPTTQRGGLSHGSGLDIDIEDMTLSELQGYFEEIDQKIDEYQQQRKMVAEKLHKQVAEIEA